MSPLLEVKNIIITNKLKPNNENENTFNVSAFILCAGYDSD